MHRLKIPLLFLFGLATGLGLAAMPETDSLLAIVQRSPAPSREKTDALNDLCWQYCYNDPLKARQYAFDAIKTAEAANYKDGEGKAFVRLGIAYDVSGNYDSAVYSYKQALTKYTAGNAKGHGSANNNLGLIEWKHGHLNEAISYFFKAMPYFEKLDDKNMLANLYNNIGLVYESISSSRKALDYFTKALALYKTMEDDENVGATYCNMNMAYQSLNKPDSSLHFLKLSEFHHQKSNNLYGLSITYVNYGTVYNLLKEYRKALDYFLRSLEMKQQMNEEEGIATLYTNIADSYLHLDDDQKFIEYMMKGLDMSRRLNLQLRLKNIYGSLGHYYSKHQQADSTYHYMHLLNAVKDSIYSQEFKTSLADAQTKYETKEKELTIRTQEYRLSKQNYYIVCLVGLLLISVLLFYALYSRFRFRQRNRLQAEIIRQQDIATKAVIQAEENERKRVASDLHDSVGQMLSAVKLNLSAFSSKIHATDELQFEKITAMVDESCKEVRAISHNMMPNSLLKNGLVSAIKEFISQIDQEKLKVHLETSGLQQRLDANTETVLYRVIQESVNNVIKHAGANVLDIQLSMDEEGISVTIEDNGKGFDISISHEGIGLKNLRSRVEFLKGSLDIQSAPGKGTLIAIFIGSR